MSKGSRNPVLQKMIFQAKLLSFRLGLSIFTIWTPRTHPRIEICDYYSKSRVSTDEWGLEDIAYNFIIQELKVTPNYDAFGHQLSHRCVNYSTIEPLSPSEHCNFFSHTMKPEFVYFVCPPLRLVVHAFKKFISMVGVTSI